LAKTSIPQRCFGAPISFYNDIHYNSRAQAVDIRLGTSLTDEWHWNRGALITFSFASRFASKRC